MLTLVVYIQRFSRAVMVSYLVLPLAYSALTSLLILPPTPLFHPVINPSAKPAGIPDEGSGTWALPFQANSQYLRHAVHELLTTIYSRGRLGKIREGSFELGPPSS